MFTDTEIGLKMGYDRRVNALAQDAQNLLNYQAGELDDALRQITKLQEALVAEQAHSAGLAAAIDALKPLAANADIMKATGRVFADGRKETGVTLIYNKAFDKKARDLGAKSIESLREQAK